MQLKTFSGKITFLFFFIFSLSVGEKISAVVANENTCVRAYDGLGYYMYLPSLFNEGTLKMTPEWAQKNQDKYCHGISAYQLRQQENGNYLDIYQMGMAFIQLPSYLIADISARALGYEPDGFSKPYHIASLLNSLFFIFLSLVYTRKLLALFFDDKVTAITLFIIYVGTNVYMTFNQLELPHLYLFALNAMVIYHLIRFQRTKIWKHIWFSSILFGLTVCIRPTQALLGIIPLIVLFAEFGMSKVFWKSVLTFPLLTIVWNTPQIMYWYFVGGQMLVPNMHSETLALSDPNIIDFMFSYRKGWILYSPIFVLLLFGFVRLYIVQKPLFWSILLFTGTYIYVMSSWECWWYAESHGSRVMVDIYPILAIAIGYFIAALKNRVTQFVAGAMILLVVGFNCLQIHQVGRSYLDTSRMSKQHYWYIFGRIDIPNYTKKHLLMDRSNTGWQLNADDYQRPDYEIELRPIFRVDTLLFSPSREGTMLCELTILDETKTDETIIEIEITTKTSDSTVSREICVGTFGEYNYYGWNNFELSKGFPQDEFVTHKFSFTIPEIRHREDKMHFYLSPTSDANITIKRMRTNARILHRN